MAISALAAAVSTGVTAFTGGAFILGTAFKHFLVTTAMGAALNALTPKPKVGRGGGYSLQGESGAALDHQIIYGETKVGGVRVYDASTGNENSFLHRIVAFAGHEINSYQQIYLNDEVVTLDGNGNVTSPTRYNGFVRIKSYLGTTGQLADPDLVAETAGLATDAGRWTTTHRLQGIAYIYVRFQYNQDAFPNGVPSVSAVIRGKKVFNPATNTTAWSDNPALCLRDYLTSDYGLSQPSSRIDDTLVNAAANICNQTVEGQKRYTCNGAFLTGAEPASIANDLLTSMGGLLWYGQGKWRMKASSWIAPTVSFNEDDLRSGISLSTRHSRRDNFNSVKGTFRGAESEWQPADYPEVSDPVFLAADNGLVNVLDFTLPFTTSSLTAQRIARIALNRNREQLTFSAAFGMRAFQVQVGDFVNITNERFGWSNKAFEVVDWTFGLTEGLDIQTQMTLREISEGVFTGVSGRVFENNNTTLPNPFLLPPVGLSILSGELRLVNEQVVGAVSVVATTNPALADRLEFQYKESNSSVFIPVGSTSDVNQSNTFEVIGISDGFFDFRVRVINYLGIRGEWTTTNNHYVTLFTAPPQNVTNFSANVVGNSLHLTWTPTSDLDLSHYKVRYATETSGASYQNARDLVVKVPRPANSLTIPAQTGTYFIKAIDKLGNPSPSAASIVVDTNLSALDGLNVIETLVQDPSFSGIKDGVVLLNDDEGNYLALDTSILFDSLDGDFDEGLGLFDGGSGGQLNTEGIYYFEDYLDLGEKYLSRVSTTMDIRYLDYANTFDSAFDLFDSREGDFDGDPSQFDTTTARTQVSHTNDDPSGSPTWTDWRDFVVGDISARAIRFRVILETSTDSATPAIRELSAAVDMPDRVEAASDITYTGATTITFPSAFKATPSLGIAATLANGDRYVISSKSKDGFTISTLTGNVTSVNPTTIDYVAKGYGKELT
jgi:hypothetical protein